PSPFPRKMETVLSDSFVTAKSILPSALKSAAAIDEGARPVAMVAGVLNVPSPLPRNTEIVLFGCLAVTRSVNPLVVKDVATTDTGPLPVPVEIVGVGAGLSA